MIDAHCHLDSERLDGSPEEALAEARQAGVEAIVMAGTEPESWDRQAELAARLEGVFPVYGVHPWLAAELSEPELGAHMELLRQRLDRDPRAVAVGETGLDGSHLAPPDSLAAQERSFRAHLELCERVGLPVVLHILRAHEPALRLLAEVGVPAAGGLVHSFSGSAELAERYVRLGLHISFCGGITRPQSRRLRAAAAAVPAERLLAETDAPDQSPEPHRGRANRPAWLPLIIEALAAARAEPVAAVARETAENARRLLLA